MRDMLIEIFNETVLECDLHGGGLLVLACPIALLCRGCDLFRLYQKQHSCLG